MLDDGVVGRPAVDERDGVQRDADADEVEDFVDEGPEQREGEIAIVNPVPFFFFFFFSNTYPELRFRLSQDEFLFTNKKR